MEEEGAWPQDTLPDLESGTCNSLFIVLYVCKVLVAEELIVLETWIVEPHLSGQLQLVECSVNLSIWHTILPVDCHAGLLARVCLAGFNSHHERPELFTIASSQMCAAFHESLD